jgi:hypothetical protein
VHIAHELQAIPGKHLVIVQYKTAPPGQPGVPEWGIHDPDHEFVHNAANIDASRIVWAHDMGESENNELIHYFHDRQVWLLNGDDPNPQPEPYPLPVQNQVAASASQSVSTAPAVSGNTSSHHDPEVR